MHKYKSVKTYDKDGNKRIVDGLPSVVYSSSYGEIIAVWEEVGQVTYRKEEYGGYYVWEDAEIRFRRISSDEFPYKLLRDQDLENILNGINKKRK